MYYILTIDGVAQESIPALDPAFPGIPIEERYAPDLLANCVKSDAPVQSGWLYDAKTKRFSEPPEPEPLPVLELPPPEPEPGKASDYVTFADLAEMLGLAAEPDSRKAIAETLSDVALVSRERKIELELELEPGIIGKPIKGLST